MTVLSEMFKLTIHSPQLDLTIVSTGHDQRQRRMKAYPINSAIVTLQHMLHNSISLPEQLW